MLFNPANVANIPESLRSLRQWVNWEMRQDKRGYTTKVPISAYTRRSASSTNSATWAPFEVALGKAVASEHLGLGIAFVPPLVGIDLDHVIGDDGTFLPWAQEILATLKGTYAERSPSGKGIHALCFGDLDPHTRHKWSEGRDRPGGELYTRGRYFTVTGERLLMNAADVVAVDRETLTSVANIIASAIAKAPRSVQVVRQVSSGDIPQGSHEDIMLDMDDPEGPHFEGFNALANPTNNALFQATWDRARTGTNKFPYDQSDSSYIMALANWAVRAQWDNQNIFRLLRAWYQKHDLPVPHRSKFTLTIWTARDDIRKGGTGRTLQSASMNPEDAREEVQQILGLEVIRLVQVGKDHATFRVELPGEVIYLGEFKDYENQHVWRKILQEHSHIDVRPMKAPAWDKIMRRIAQLVEVEELPDISQEAELRAWIDDYAKSVRDGATAETLKRCTPFRWKGALWLHLDTFYGHLRVTGAQVTRRQLIGRLRTIGAETRPVYRTEEETGKDVKGSYWRVPDGSCADEKNLVES